MSRYPIVAASAATPITAGVAAKATLNQPVSEFGYWVAAHTWMSLGDWGVVCGIVIGVSGLIWRIIIDRRKS